MNNLYIYIRRKNIIMSKSAVISQIDSSDDFQVAIATINSEFAKKAKAYLGKKKNTILRTQALKDSAVMLLEELKKSPAADNKERIEVIDQVIGIYEKGYSGSFKDNCKKINKDLEILDLKVSTKTATNTKLVETITAECNNSFDWHNGNISVNKPAMDKQIEAIKASKDVELLRIMTWHLSAASTFGRAVAELESAENAQEKDQEQRFALLKEDHLKDMQKGLRLWQASGESEDSPNLISYYINKLKNLDYAQAKELYSDTKQHQKNDAINFLDEQVKSINTIIDALPDQHRKRILKVQDDLLPKPEELAHLKILFDQELVFYEAVYQESLQKGLKSEQLEELKNFQQGMIKDVEKLQKRHQEICGLESESCKVFNDVLQGMQSHKGEELSAEKLSELKAKKRKVDFRMRYLTRKDEAKYDREIEQAASKMSDSTKNLINTFREKIAYIAAMDGALLRTKDWLQHTGKENSIFNELKIDDRERGRIDENTLVLENQPPAPPNKRQEKIDDPKQEQEKIDKNTLVLENQPPAPPKISGARRFITGLAGVILTPLIYIVVPLQKWSQGSKSVWQDSFNVHLSMLNGDILKPAAPLEQNINYATQIAPQPHVVDESKNIPKNPEFKSQVQDLAKNVIGFVVPNSIEVNEKSQVELLKQQRQTSKFPPSQEKN